MTDTFPRRLIENAEKFSERPAIREKDLGIWQTWTWRQMRDEIFDFANGLSTLGFSRGDKLAIVGTNRPRLYWGICAAQCLGGIPVPVYADSVAEEMRYVLEHAEASIVLAEDQEQVDKVLEVMSGVDRLKCVIYDDSRGLKDYDHSFLHDFSEVQESGRRLAQEKPDFLSREIELGTGSDTAIILYTSGTTGHPKGVVLTHDNVLITSLNSARMDNLTEKEEMLSYLPLAWVGDHIFSYGQAYVTGMCSNCPESEATVHSDIREIGPTYYFAPPRVFEQLLTSVMIRMEDAGRLKQRMFHAFMAVASRCGTDILDGNPVSLSDRILYTIGNWLIYAPLKNTMGFSRIRVAYTAGEAIGPEIFDFFRSLGVNIKQLYGQTEAAVFITAQPDGEVYADTVGKPSPDVEVKITDDGEVVYRSPGVFQCYYKNEKATHETKNEEGWVMTGDAGYFDDKGHLKIIDRAKDVGKLKSGALFAPKYIENKLKFFPQIKEVVALGRDMDHAAAIVNIDLDAVGNWAERNNIPYSSYQELAGHPRIYEMIKSNIEQVNRDLSEDSVLSGCQIRRFLILHKELDADDGELTRTRKVRRRIIAEKYGVLINALYSDAQNCHVSTEVTFEDGRKGTIEGDLRIEDAQVFESLRKAG
ncbi:MAG: long-chain fatty acid--CoA ligase [Gammaproteobacteria bacterium]|nr:long-chain fatty acid--CoA ligase [Gammaproteobacteria bacterium]MYD75285.1 long-chain fatty acid--CoA ligase [Gammaproteobacteria bacterium]MYJ52544.1 long-chain fatty acid--CoA ligase [Gammaproteobacteria bacterium]